MPRIQTPIVVLGIFVACLTSAAAQSYVNTTAPVLPVIIPGASVIAYAQYPGQSWRRAECRLEDNLLTPPVSDGDIRPRLAINPASHWQHSSPQAPITLEGIKVNGLPAPALPSCNHGAVSIGPLQFTMGFVSPDVPIDFNSIRVSLASNWIGAEQVSIEAISAKRARVTVRFDNPEPGRFILNTSIADVAPYVHEAHSSIAFRVVDITNAVQALEGVTVAVDSWHNGYEYPDTLIDGVTSAKNTSGGGQFSWASEETAVPHWAQITLPTVHEIREVTLWWIGTPPVTSRHIQIQVFEDHAWKTVYNSPTEGETQARFTKCQFKPVTTSRFRLYQEPGGGTPDRPNILWLNEIEAR